MSEWSEDMTEISEGSVKHFTTDMLPLYHGPFVKIRLKPSGIEYTVSKGLLCAESPVFSAMFQPGCREYQEGTVTLQEVEDIITIRGIEALIQWLYLRIVKFDIEDEGDHISAAIELARLAETYNIAGIESQVAQDIEEVISSFSDDNSALLISEHISSGTFLSHEHPVRRTLVRACVAGCFEKKPHKFAQEIEDYPTFAVDLLQEVQLALNETSFDFRDPFICFHFITVLLSRYNSSQAERSIWFQKTFCAQFSRRCLSPDSENPKS
ncbi:hypothetical protein N7449_010623 [Penicillium cf. viridicatum]|uniref:BTB domain-containing protein n=1 Tax=Penicillium cf. viridicatum TaxID=2972119 RepID=A0A9W9M3Q8_9EURO|nr:hypothetical protein N7449_010623 [Penicillium cf. viridicatum]